MHPILIANPISQLLLSGILICHIVTIFALLDLKQTIKTRLHADK
jgi:hypothetical protein